MTKLNGKGRRRKGINAERELVRILKKAGINAKRIPLSGATEYQKGDILIDNIFVAEVKRRKRVALLYDMLKGANIGFIRADGKQWLAILDIDFFIQLYNKNKED